MWQISYSPENDASLGIFVKNSKFQLKNTVYLILIQKLIKGELFWGSNVSLFAALYFSCLDLKALLALTLSDIFALIATLLHWEGRQAKCQVG